MTSRCKVALITAEYPPQQGGVGDYTACLGAALVRAGCTVEVLTTYPLSGVPVPPLDASGCAGTEEASRVEVRREVHGWGWGLWPEMARLLGTGRPDVVIIQYQTGAYGLHPAINGLPGWLRRRVPGLPVITTMHDLREPYLFPKAGRARRWVNRVLMGQSAAVVVTNPQDAAALPPALARKAAGIPIGANITPHPPPGWSRETWRAARDIPDDVPLAAYFGFLNASKGLDTLLRALQAVRAGGSPVRLLMVGGGVGSSDPTNRATAAALTRLTRDLGVAEAIHWTGYVPPSGVSAALLSADLAVLPFADGASFRRGSLLAVMAHGLPVVSTAPRQPEGDTRPAPRRLTFHDWPQLQNGDNALLTSLDDPAALAAAIVQVTTDPALRDRLAAGARASAAWFDWDRIAADYLALFGRIGMR
jgi:glycosyltransferase involved in cell wall biosynthesis